jgi:PAS domain S-box-containing protein
MEQVHQSVHDFQDQAQASLDARAREAKASYRVMVLTILLTVLLGCLLVGVIVYLHGRNLRTRALTFRMVDREREKLRVTLASIGDAVLTTDETGRVSFLNRLAEELTGWTLEDALGQSFTAVLTLVNERTRTPVENPIERVLEHGVIVGLANHTILIARDGSEHPIDDSAAPIRDSNGQLIGVVLVFRDVSEPRKAERELRESRERLALAMTAAGIGIWQIDFHQHCIWRDASLNQMLGVSQQDSVLALDEWYAGMHPEDRSKLFDAMEQAKLDGAPFEIEVRASHRDDKVRWLRKRGKIIQLDKEDPDSLAMTGITLDVTQEKASEQQVYQLLTELRQADRRKDEFLATLAHELRGPLAPLRNMLEVIKRAENDGEIVEQAHDTMERQLGQMIHLVDDLLDINRISRGVIELRRKPVELASVVHQSLEACRPLAEAANHRMTVSLPEEPIFIDGDAVRLAQVFSNLLNNACKYMESGGQIDVTGERLGSEVLVRIRDTGVGIPTDRLDAIFDMFSQVHHSEQRSQGGLGIGLTLVRQLVEMHGGSVSAESAGPGHGSVFTVRLPVMAAPVPDMEDIGSPWPAIGTRQRRILVVDDNQDSAASLAMLLELSGHQTAQAHNGLDAIERAQQFQPDLILLDIGLPKMSGHDVCRHIHAQPWGCEIPIIALTGWGQTEDRRMTTESGFVAHLVKPVDFAALSVLLQNLPNRPASPPTP